MNKNNLVLVIQARFASSRFPGKIVKDLSGKPMLSRILQRVKKVKKIRGLMN